MKTKKKQNKKKKNSVNTGVSKVSKKSVRNKKSKKNRISDRRKLELNVKTLKKIFRSKYLEKNIFNKEVFVWCNAIVILFIVAILFLSGNYVVFYDKILFFDEFIHENESVYAKLTVDYPINNVNCTIFAYYENLTASKSIVTKKGKMKVIMELPNMPTKRVGVFFNISCNLTPDHKLELMND